MTSTGPFCQGAGNPFTVQGLLSTGAIQSVGAVQSILLPASMLIANGAVYTINANANRDIFDLTKYPSGPSAFRVIAHVANGQMTVAHFGRYSGDAITISNDGSVSFAGILENTNGIISFKNNGVGGNADFSFNITRVE
jgi:hypothetical protein